VWYVLKVNQLRFEEPGDILQGRWEDSSILQWRCWFKSRSSKQITCWTHRSFQFQDYSEINRKVSCYSNKRKHVRDKEGMSFKADKRVISKGSCDKLLWNLIYFKKGNLKFRIFCYTSFNIKEKFVSNLIYILFSEAYNIKGYSPVLNFEVDDFE